MNRRGGGIEMLLWLGAFIVFGPAIAAAFVGSFNEVREILTPIAIAAFTAAAVIYVARNRW